MQLIRLITIAALVAFLASCTTTFPKKYELSDEMSKALKDAPDETQIILVFPDTDKKDGKKFQVINTRGESARICKTPETKTGKDAEKGKYYRKEGECLGVGTGYKVLEADNIQKLSTAPNPHGCDRCDLWPIAPGIWFEMCYPLGCEKIGH